MAYAIEDTTQLVTLGRKLFAVITVVESDVDPSDEGDIDLPLFGRVVGVWSRLTDAGSASTVSPELGTAAGLADIDINPSSEAGDPVVLPLDGVAFASLGGTGVIRSNPDANANEVTTTIIVDLTHESGGAAAAAAAESVIHQVNFASVMSGEPAITRSAGDLSDVVLPDGTTLGVQVNSAGFTIDTSGLQGASGGGVIVYIKDVAAEDGKRYDFVVEWSVSAANRTRQWIGWREDVGATLWHCGRSNNTVEAYGSGGNANASETSPIGVMAASWNFCTAMLLRYIRQVDVTSEDYTTPADELARVWQGSISNDGVPDLSSEVWNPYVQIAPVLGDEPNVNVVKGWTVRQYV